MSEYMILLAENENAPAVEQQLLEAREQFTAVLKAKGAFLDAERLRSSTEAARVKAIDGQVQVERGPFEGAVGGYWAVRADGLEAAVALARQLPLAPGESVEVRPVMKGDYQPGKTEKTGKVFAFAVLGNSPNEEAWIRLMNEIDSETKDSLRDASFVAGVRLEAPRTGRRLVNQHGKTVTLDGPFLESKEVIGGVFFRRIASLDDAVEWVKKTAFVKIGGAEVREVWRS